VESPIIKILPFQSCAPLLELDDELEPDDELELDEELELDDELEEEFELDEELDELDELLVIAAPLELELDELAPSCGPLQPMRPINIKSAVRRWTKFIEESGSEFGGFQAYWCAVRGNHPAVIFVVSFFRRMI
jgi:hypothetical protein